MQKETIKEGDGKTYPKPGQIVTIHYTGTVRNYFIYLFCFLFLFIIIAEYLLVLLFLSFYWYNLLMLLLY